MLYEALAIENPALYSSDRDVASHDLEECLLRLGRDIVVDTQSHPLFSAPTNLSQSCYRMASIGIWLPLVHAEC